MNTIIKFLELFNSVDDAGNVLSATPDGNLYLRLKSDKRNRNIGRFEQRNDNLIYVKHDTEKQIFQKNNSWSLMYNVVRLVFGVEVHTKERIYKITTDDIKQHGDFLWFKNQGYEKKIYVPLKYWWKSDFLKMQQSHDGCGEKASEQDGRANFAR